MSAASALIEQLKQANASYAADFDAEGVPGRAKQRLLLLTCMDSRIVPHAVFGLKEGDMKVIRNAGGQLNEEVINDIIIASHLLDCECVILMPHTRCAMASHSLASMQEALAEHSGMDFSEFPARVIVDPHDKLRSDVALLSSHPLLHPGVSVHGAIYNVDDGCVVWL